MGPRSESETQAGKGPGPQSRQKVTYILSLSKDADVVEARILRQAQDVHFLFRQTSILLLLRTIFYGQMLYHPDAIFLICCKSVVWPFAIVIAAFFASGCVAIVCAICESAIASER